MVRLKDIAAEANVSVMTVSNVVNGNLSKVSKEKADEIQAILRKRNYVQNASARSLAKANSNIVAIMLRNIDNENSLSSPHNATLVGIIIQQVQALGYYAMVSLVQNKEDISRNLRTWNVRGAIFLGMFDDEIEQISTRTKTPAVFIDSYSHVRQICSVGIDDYKGGVMAANCLLQHGHKQIAFVSPPDIDNGVIHHRLSGFTDTLLKNGISADKLHRFVLLSDNDPAAASDTIDALYSLRHEITAVFATSDHLAARLIGDLSERGIRIPDELSVIGYDNMSICTQIYPHLTSIAQDLHQKAVVAVEILQRQLENPSAPAEIRILDVKLVERGTVQTI